MVNYLVICVSEFAERFQLDNKAAYRFLAAHGGIRFLTEHYEIEHTLGLDDVIDDLESVCRENSGVPQ
jgi:hypothetical protein